MQKPNLKILILAIIVILVIAGGIFWRQKDNINNLFFGELPKACTQEAKLCPDGSYVGRTGPNCEFAACPESPTCKNLCGDGVCQEVVCTAIGCLCPETKESCPQDCNELLDTSNWQTYRNEEYGFEFEHPADWYFVSFPDDMLSHERTINYFMRITATKNPEAKIVEGALEGGGVDEGNFTVDVFVTQGVDFVEKRCEFLMNQPNFLSMECKQKIFFDFPAVEIINKKNGIITEKAFFIDKKGIIYDIYLENPLLKESQDLSSLFNQILSTFKFIK